MAPTELGTGLDDGVGALVVGASALLGWVLMVTLTGGWGEPTIVVWSLLMMLAVGLTLYGVDRFGLPGTA